MEKSPDAFRTISEVSEWLDTPSHVLRFWESRFAAVSPVKRAGGRRYYRPEDMALLGGIKKLLHDDGMTIKAVQEIIDQQGAEAVAAMAPSPAHAAKSEEQSVPEPEATAGEAIQKEAPDKEDVSPTDPVAPSEGDAAAISVSQKSPATDQPKSAGDAETPGLFDELPTFSVRRREPPLRSTSKQSEGVIDGDLAKTSKGASGGFRIVRGDGKIKERQSRLSLSLTGVQEETVETSETVQEAFIYAEEDLSEVDTSEHPIELTEVALSDAEETSGLVVDGILDDDAPTHEVQAEEDPDIDQIDEPALPLKPIDGIPEDPDDECRAPDAVPLPAEIRALVWQSEKPAPASLDDLTARLAMLSEKLS
ncbi:MAG: MerR family transcriptional regulator [Pseudomonadota bacterium]